MTFCSFLLCAMPYLLLYVVLCDAFPVIGRIFAYNIYTHLGNQIPYSKLFVPLLV